MAQGGERNVPPEPPKASCSLVGGEGRLVPASLSKVALAETVKAPARMPARNKMSMPSCGGREGIKGSGVSRRSKRNGRIPSFLYYSYRKKEIIHLNHQPRERDDFYHFFKRVNNAMATSSPPR